MIERLQIKSLEFTDLSYELNSELTIFNNVSFKFPMNSVVWIKSEPGAGKSSLLRLIDGLSFSTSGEYKINDQPVSEMSFEEFNHYKLNMGYSFDFGGMINNRTLFQNLALPLEYHNIFSHSERQDKVTEMLKQFGILQVADKRPSAVPGTIRKAMCVARAFIHEPQLVLLDDPTTGLRAETKTVLKNLIKNHTKNIKNSTVYITSEDEAFMRDIADYCIELNQTELKLVDMKEQAA